MAPQTTYSTSTLANHVGRDFGLSAPILLDQTRIDRFAQCTGDTQWIHVDVDRARTEGPFLGTIAHGLLVLSLIPAAHFELGVYPSDAANVLNYGFDRVRFLAPVPAGTLVQLRVGLTEVTAKPNGSFLIRCKNTVHSLVDASQPLMVADSLAVVTA
jgi:acyl dehydratase